MLARRASAPTERQHRRVHLDVGPRPRLGQHIRPLEQRPRRALVTASRRRRRGGQVVSERLGHANPGFTMATYQHVLPGMGADAANRFSRLITIDDR